MFRGGEGEAGYTITAFSGRSNMQWKHVSGGRGEGERNTPVEAFRGTQNTQLRRF